jgi:type VI secretion system Hcp family effector
MDDKPRSAKQVPGRLLLCAALFVVATPLLAALEPCVTMTGASSGFIEGEPRLSRCSGASFEAQEYHHLVRRRPNTADAERHESVVFIRKSDKASPKLWAALRDRDTLTVHFDFYRSDGGTTERFYVVELRDAKIMAIEPITADIGVTATTGLPDRERLRVAYSSMVVRYLGETEPEAEDLVNSQPPS